MISTGLLQQKAANRYRAVLRGLILGEAVFPLPIRVQLPAHTAPLAQLREVYAAIRSQSKECLQNGYSVEWETVATRRYGNNPLPVRLFFASREDFFGYLGKLEEAERILGNAASLVAAYPQLQPWCGSNIAHLEKPAETVRYALNWVDYLCRYPHPQRYAREIPVAAPTKFISHEGPMVESLLQVVAPHALNPQGNGVEERLGLLTPASLIEFRCLQAGASALPFPHGMASAADIAARGDLFAGYRRILIVENRITFLTLPALPHTLAVLGSGFAVSRLQEITWLRDGPRLAYWGDIDVPGLLILASLRRVLPQVEPVLMDSATFAAFSRFHQPRGEQMAIHQSQVLELRPAERDLLHHLAQAGLRLEQEHIDCAFAAAALRAFCAV